MTTENQAHYVSDQIAEGPSCHVCGAILTKAEKGWECKSCGEKTEPTRETASWYAKNRDNILLNRYSRNLVEQLIERACAPSAPAKEPGQK